VRWKRWLVIGLVVAAVTLLVVYGYRPQPTLVDIAEVKRGPMRVTVEEEGKTRVRDRYVVSAPVAGIAPRLDLDIGDRVQESQVLLDLEPLRPVVLDSRSRAEAEARVAAAKAALDAAQERAKAAAADAGYWEGQVARMKELYKTDDVSRETYDRTVTQARQAAATQRSAEHNVEAARSELEAARAALQYTASSQADDASEKVAVHAPVGGRVLKVVHKSEGVVTAGEPLLEIANAHSLEVMVELLSADAVRVGPGTRVVFERWGGDVPLEGRVRLVEPVAFTKISALGVEEQRVRVIVDFTSPQKLWQRLGDGYRVEASFILWEGQDVLQVPSSALFRYKDGWAVFAVQEGTARRQIVEIGHRSGLVAEVISGLSEGQKVITHPDNSIEDGAQVKPRVGGA
jgi:HlyD family secretion protein